MAGRKIYVCTNVHFAHTPSWENTDVLKHLVSGCFFWYGEFSLSLSFFPPSSHFRQSRSLGFYERIKTLNRLQKLVHDIHCQEGMAVAWFRSDRRFFSLSLDINYGKGIEGPGKNLFFALSRLSDLLPSSLPFFRIGQKDVYETGVYNLIYLVLLSAILPLHCPSMLAAGSIFSFFLLAQQLFEHGDHF